LIWIINAIRNEVTNETRNCFSTTSRHSRLGTTTRSENKYATAAACSGFIRIGDLYTGGVQPLVGARHEETKEVRRATSFVRTFTNGIQTSRRESNSSWFGRSRRRSARKGGDKGAVDEWPDRA